jgi:chemotaxis protein MotB
MALAGCPGPKHTYPDGTGLEAQLEREVQALQQTVRRLEAEAATCAEGKADPVYAEVHQVLATIDEVDVGHNGPVTFVVLPDAHLFGSDAVSVRDEARMTLDLLATALKLHPEYEVVIEGHTADAHPNAAVARKYPDLWVLSYARAAAVMKVLVRDFGMSEDRFVLVARGPHSPMVANDTGAGQARNRRVVVYIYPPDTRR